MTSQVKLWLTIALGILLAWLVGLVAGDTNPNSDKLYPNVISSFASSFVSIFSLIKFISSCPFLGHRYEKHTHTVYVI